jgi:Cu(I)/Ag(I) efflux system membrane fusion protein
MNRIGVLLLLVGVALGAVVGYVVHRPTSAAPQVANATAKPKADREVLYWYDPMQPNQHFDKPGKSPYMDMQLLPKYADDSRGGVSIELDARAAQSLGIRTAKVERESLKHDLRAVGTIGYDEDAVEVVQARVTGFVQHLYVRAPLDRVRQGQPLIDIVAPDWVAAQEEYLALQNADSTLRDAARTRLVVLGMPEDQIRAIERSGLARTHTTLVAPINGVIAELGARDGMAVMPGTPLFRINGLSKVWITAEVPEAEASDARDGTAVSISVPAWPAKTFPGKVLAVLPSVAAATRTLQVRIEAANPNDALTPGMYAKVAFESQAREPQLVVPSEAVIRTGARAVVIVAEASGFRPVEVATGAEGEGKTEILRGLDEGERIVLSGQFLIDSEASLRATLTRLSPPASEAKP